jgi:hypothetical protein
MVRPRLSKSREKVELKAALQLCDDLIKHVEQAQLGNATTDTRFFMQFMEAANDLSHSLELLGIVVNPGLRDYCESGFCEFGDDREPTSLTEFGLPVYEATGVVTGLIVQLVPLWLRHMREFRDAIAGVPPSAQCRKPNSKGGRPKKPATKRLETDLQTFVTEERERLKKNGMSGQEVIARFSQFTWQQFVCGVNETYGRAYNLTPATRRQVQRSPTWQTLHGIVPPQASDTPIEDSLARDNSWAAAEQLSPSSRIHQRTKLGRR